jgi:hypothetical protein
LAEAGQADLAGEAGQVMLVSSCESNPDRHERVALLHVTRFRFFIEHVRWGRVIRKTYLLSVQSAD